MSWLNRIKNAVVPKLPFVPSSPPPAAKAPDKKPGGLTGWFQSTFEKATHNPLTNAAGDLIHNPGKALQHATQGTLRLALDGADKFIPNSVKTDLLKGVEKGVDGAAKLAELTFGKDSSVAKTFDEFSQVDLEGITRQQGLKGDWLKLWGTWLTEDKPKSLGTWSKEPGTGRDLVTVTEPSPYVTDLKNRPQQKDALAQFMKEHNPPKVGDTTTVPFSFTGPGTAEKGKYGPVEWFLGSYQTQLKCTSVDPVTGKANLEVTVTNESHFQSGTRVNGDAQNNLGLPKYLIGDRERGQGLGLGGNFDQKYIYHETVDLPRPAVA